MERYSSHQVDIESKNFALHHGYKRIKTFVESIRYIVEEPELTALSFVVNILYVFPEKAKENHPPTSQSRRSTRSLERKS